MTSIYNPLVPTGLLFLSVDYKNIQNNFSWLDTAFKKNHTPLTASSNPGRHTFVEMNGTLGGNTVAGKASFIANILPNLINGFETLYAGVDDTYTIGNLFFTRGSGGVQIQLTRGPPPGPANSFTGGGGGLGQVGAGWTFLPGGMILQYGAAKTTLISPFDVNITFAPPFIRNVYSVIASIDGPNTATVAVGNISLSGFRILGYGPSKPVYWFAIGN